METIKQRLRSPVVWAAVFAQAAIIAGLFCPQLPDQIKAVGGAVVEILTIFGILNNPTEYNKF